MTDLTQVRQHNGKSYAWDNSAKDWVEVNPGAGAGQGFIGSALATVGEGGAAISDLSADIQELMGMDASALRAETAQGRQELQQLRQATGGTTIAPDAALAGDVAGTAFQYGAGFMPMRLAPAVGLEATLGFGFTPGPLDERAQAAAVASMGPIAAQTIFRTIYGTGNKAESMSQKTTGILREFDDALQSYRMELGSQAPQAGSAGAASVRRGQEGTLFDDELDAWFGEMSPAQRNFINRPEGADPGPYRMALKRFQESGEGQTMMGDQTMRFGQKFMQEIDARPGAELSRINVADAMDDIGERMTAIRNQYPAMKSFDKDFVDDMKQLFAASDAPAIRGLKRHLSDPQTFEQQVNRSIRNAERLQEYQTAGALRGIKEDAAQEFYKTLPKEAKEAYRELQAKYARAAAMLDNETSLTSTGKFNVKSYVNNVSKRYKKFRMGTADDDVSRAMRTMQTLQERQVTGSNTVEKLVEKARSNPGAVGLMGLLGL